MEKNKNVEETQGEKSADKTIQLTMSMMNELTMNEVLYNLFQELVMEGMNSKMAFHTAKYLAGKEVKPNG